MGDLLGSHCHPRRPCDPVRSRAQRHVQLWSLSRTILGDVGGMGLDFRRSRGAVHHHLRAATDLETLGSEVVYILHDSVQSLHVR